MLYFLMILVFIAAFIFALMKAASRLGGATAFGMLLVGIVTLGVCLAWGMPLIGVFPVIAGLTLGTLFFGKE